MIHDPDLLEKTGSYKTVSDIFAFTSNIFRKPDRRSVTEIAENCVKIVRPGSSKFWDKDQTPYMVDPQNLLSSRELSAIIFCGPSQTGKTESMILNFIAYSVIQDPMDMILYNPTQAASRDFSVRRVDRLNFNSPEIKARLMKGRSSDSKQNKIYKSGMILSLSWPTVSEFAGKPVGRIALTDYDRMDDKIGDEGSPFDLAFMRTTTFQSLAMTVAESSPSRPIEDLRWIKETPHQAPPTKGILSLYNRGDRRRWYWPHLKLGCGEYFEGKFTDLKWEEKENPLDAADTVKMICPVCGGEIMPDEKREMNLYGIWLKDNQHIDDKGNIVGRGPRSRIASFWLNGVAAGMQTWKEMVVKYINATKEYERTGSEEALKQFHNNDVGEPYRSKAQELERLPEVLRARAESLPTIAPGVRFLIAAIDVQKNAFVVQVHGIGPGTPYDITIVERFKILQSERFDGHITPETPNGSRLWVKPGTNQEDWDLLIDQVMLKTYEIDDGSGKVMTIKMTVCDSGGMAGVTTNAYEFYRKLKRKGLAGRFQLVKGNHIASSPRSYIDFPDQRRKDKLAAARGDVPVMFLNSNLLKDALANRLESITPGTGMIRFPDWLPDWFYKELCAEHRTEKGWENTQGTRNEAWDLLYYTIGVCASKMLGVEFIDWQNPPSWAAEWNKNTLVVKKENSEVLTYGTTQVTYNFADLGKALAS